MYRAGSNTNDPVFLAKWEPLRLRLRPAECHMGADGVCWVKEPYRALSHATQHAPRCNGCGGLIGEWRGGGLRGPRRGLDAL